MGNRRRAVPASLTFRRSPPFTTDSKRLLWKYPPPNTNTRLSRGERMLAPSGNKFPLPLPHSTASGRSANTFVLFRNFSP